MSDIFDETEENLRTDRVVAIVKVALPWVSAILVLALVIALSVWGWQSWRVTQSAHATLCRVEEIPELANPGRGVTVIKTDETDPVMGFGVGTRKDKVLLIVETDGGKEIPVGSERLSVTARGGKGHGLMRKTKIVLATQPAPVTPPPLLN